MTLQEIEKSNINLTNKTTENLWLKEMRCNLGKTQKEIALMCNLSQPGYANIENGTTKPSVKTAKLIAQSLNFNWTLFF